VDIGCVRCPGPRPFSERETLRIWFHQHMNLVWAFGPSRSAGRIYARAAGMRFYHHHWLDGTATNWQTHHLRGSAAFTVELPAGSPSSAQMRRQVRAVVTSSRGSG